MFPGQGAQYVGMGKEFYEKFPQAEDIYNQASDILGYDISRICFEGPEEKLVQTRYSQPALFITSFVSLAILQKEMPQIRPDAVGGLSLGEYTALVCAGAITFQDGLKLVQYRGEFMDEASKLCAGGMLSVIGLSEQEVRAIVGDKVDIANLNCPGQVVISGDKKEIEKLAPLFKKAILLKVNGPFHSRLMEPARVKLEPFIAKAEIKKPGIVFTANVTGSAVEDPEEIKKCLIKQLVSSTYWQGDIETMLSMGIDTFIEIGPGKVLGGLLKRIRKGIRYFNVGDLSSLRSTVEGLDYAAK